MVMTILFEEGFESGDFSKESGTYVPAGCTATVVTSPVHSGVYSASFYATVNNVAAIWKIFDGNLAYPVVSVDFYFLLPTLPIGGSGYAIMTYLFNRSGASEIQVGNIALHHDGVGYLFQTVVNGVYVTSGYLTLTANVWYHLKFDVVISQTLGSQQLWLDDTSILVGTNLNTGVMLINTVNFPSQNAFATPYASVLDDIVISGDSAVPIPPAKGTISIHAKIVGQP